MLQLSDEWFSIRQCKLTASHAQAIAANGKGLQTYVREMMAEYYSSAEKVYFQNEHTKRGNELEPLAAMAYEFKTGLKIQTIGFVEYNKYVGCSPDLLVGDEGLAEIKCPADKTYFNYMLDGKINTKYLWQMHMQMLVCKRMWCDYVVFNPHFKQDLIIQRVFWDKKKVLKLLKGFGSGIRMIRKIKQKMGGR